MNNERIYIVEWRCVGVADTTREIITATSIPQLFDYYTDIPDLVEFAFEDVSDASIEDIERRLTYNGKYTV